MKRKFEWFPRPILCLVLFAVAVPNARGQQRFFTSEDVIKYTPDWHGERFPDGRSKGTG